MMTSLRNEQSSRLPAHSRMFTVFCCETAVNCRLHARLRSHDKAALTISWVNAALGCFR